LLRAIDIESYRLLTGFILSFAKGQSIFLDMLSFAFWFQLLELFGIGQDLFQLLGQIV
jgi:hypothetical protein